MIDIEEIQPNSEEIAEVNREVGQVDLKDTADVNKEVEEFVNKTLELMGIVSRATVCGDGNTLNVKISGEDTAAVIGFRGEVLDALQYLTLTVMNEHGYEYKKVVLNCENYREKRQETLTALANRVAAKAIRLCRKVELEPMNPFERRIIHSALADNPDVKTESEGENLSRHIVIIPVNVELKSDKPLKNGGDRNDRHDRFRRDGRRERREGRKGGKYNRDDRRKSREDEAEVEDGNVYSGYFTNNSDFVKAEPQKGAPKFKSFGGRKKF